MIDDIINLIDQMISEIYLMKFQKISEQYLQLLDKIEAVLQEFAAAGYQINMVEELTELQQSFQKRDYIDLADCLLYQMKKNCSELKKIAGL